MSNKHQKHPTCACADALSTIMIPLGLIITLTYYYQPKAQRNVHLLGPGDFESMIHMEDLINKLLRSAPSFAELPPVNEDKSQ